ncbi:AraC family transcriptional regulator [Acinetobacter vivianii]|uniref:AraC family transcriptional regulator n=1 Tax=Acinetobacter vivianii TaxID=1776742 RepID=UPI002DBF127A|nr:helix-turn-helix transcriptional regulator [Acinetobacter vivianii]MEB6480061.1 helix-turn-helix transcriptional regulator [Acinetobacter vivianii]MEB6658178.1 helix-turn-helix transcriptional regulator [Acinetobacter vivianii]
MGKNFKHGFLDYPVYAFSENYPHGHIEDWHSHDRIQLIHTLTGVIRIQTHEGIWIIPPGRGVWIPAHKPHALLSSGDVRARGVFIENTTQHDIPNQCRVVAIPALLRELMSSAMDIQNEIQPESRNERLLQLILDEVRLLPALAFNLPDPQNPKLQQLCQRIKENLALEWSLEESAQQLHISSKTLARHFQKETGLHFSHWVRQAKLMQAMIDLAMNKPVLNVALDLGYESPSAFSAMFKRETSMTPSDYLKQFSSPTL